MSKLVQSYGNLKVFSMCNMQSNRTRREKNKRYPLPLRESQRVSPKLFSRERDGHRRKQTIFSHTV